MRSSLFPVMTTLLVGACAPDIGIRVKPDEPAENFPVIRVEPTSIDFGEKTSLESVTETVTVYNDGVAVLSIDDIQLIADPSFELSVMAATPIDVAPGASTQFDVTFQPQEGGSLTGQALVLSNADNEPEYSVPFAGLGALSALEITPNPMRFGTRLIPCDTQQNFTLTNRGTEPVTISSMALGGDAEPLDFPVSPPANLTLYEGQSWQVPVRFTPETELTFDANFTVVSDDPAGDQTVPISGTAQYVTSTTDVFDVPEEQPIDLIFAVDQSCSMDSHAQSLAGQFSSFVNVFNQANVDWRIGVVTNDNGCFNSGTITRNTPSWGSVFTNAVSLGSDGQAGYSLTEDLLHLTHVAMQASCNLGFRSPGAPLHVVVVSDEADQSSQDWSWYLGNYAAYAGAGTLHVHGVVDLYPNGGVQCGGTPGGPGQYQNIVNATGGFLLDVCNSSWPTQFASVAQAAVNDLSVYDLSSPVPVDPDSIEVRVDGAVQPNGWTYDPNDIAVVFDPLPPGGSHIEISYGVTPACP